MATKTLTVKDAAKRADEARETYEDLRARLRDGDTSVTRDALEAARAESEYADDLLAGAHANERRRKNEERVRWAEGFTARTRKEIDASNLDVAAKLDAIRGPVRELAKAVDRANRLRHALGAEWDEHRPEDIPHGPDGNKRLPEDYKKAKPTKAHSYAGTHDDLRLVLGVALEALEEVRKPQTADHQERHRTLGAIAKASMMQLREAVGHAKQQRG